MCCLTSRCSLQKNFFVNNYRSPSYAKPRSTTSAAPMRFSTPKCRAARSRSLRVKRPCSLACVRKYRSRRLSTAIPRRRDPVWAPTVATPCSRRLRRSRSSRTLRQPRSSSVTSEALLRGRRIIKIIMTTSCSGRARRRATSSPPARVTTESSLPHLRERDLSRFSSTCYSTSCIWW